MHKISRILVANAGVPDAWYSGQVIPFTDITTDEPTHTVYNLTNGGGKTTIMSLIFSTIDTEKTRFLQTLGNSKKRFDEYFDKTGVPGFIVIEWALAGDSHTPARRLVTGQIVVMRGAGELMEAERFFFSFRSNDTLSLDTLPAPGLGNTALRNREECLKWLEATEQAHRGNFQKFVQQSSWRENLISKGIDVDMFRQQVEMNRREGQQDDTLLNFKSETDFVHKFLGGTLNTTLADETRAVIAELCKKFASRKELKDKLDQMTRLTERFEPFCAAAVLLSESLDKRDTLFEGTAQTAVTLRGHESRLQALAGTETLRAADEQSRATLHEQQARIHAASAEALEALGKKRTFDAATTHAASAVARHRELAHRKVLISAAEASEEVQQLEAKLAELNKLIDTTNERDIRPLREAAGRASALYRGRLQQSTEERTSRVEILDAEIDALREVAATLNAVEAGYRKDRDGYVSERAGHQAYLRRAELALENLVKSAALANAGEPVEAAHSRLTAKLEALEAALEEAEALATASAEEAQHEAARGASASADKARDELKAAELTRQIRVAQSLREELVDHPDMLAAWSTLLAADDSTGADTDSTVHLDASGLLSHVIEQVEHRYAAVRTASRELEDLQSAERDIRETGLSARDTNVDAVVETLKAAGIAGAMAYADYLSRVLPDADSARALVLSDPARYLGVAIASAADLEKAVIATASLKLARPVTISAYSTDGFGSDDNRFVVGPTDNAAFNLDEARAKAEALAESLSRAESDVHHARMEHSDAQRLVTRFEEYLAKYGDGKFADLLTSQDELQSRIYLLDAQIAENTHRAGVARKAEAQARAQAKTQAGELKSVTALVNTVEHYQREYSDLQPVQAKVLQLDGEVEALDAKLEDCAISRETDARTLADHQHEKLNCTHEISRLAQVMAQLTDVDAAFDAVAELQSNPQSEAALKVALENAQALLETAQSGTTAELIRQGKEAERDLKQKQTRFASRYPASDAPRESFEVFIGVDYTVALREAHQEETQAADVARAAEGDRKVAQDALESFERKREYAERVADEASVTDAELATRFEEESAKAQDAWGRHGVATERANEARQQAGKASTEAARYGEYAEGFEQELPADWRIRLSDYAADASQFTDISTLAASVRAARKELKEVLAEVSTHSTSVSRLYGQVTKLALDESFAKVDLALAIQLRQNSPEHAAQDRERLSLAIANRTSTLRSDLESLEGDFTRAVSELNGLVKNGLSNLERAVTGLTLPEDAPIVGGLPVFKYSTTATRMSQEERLRVLRAFMEELAQEPERIPQSGAELAARAIIKMANGRLGIKFLKMTTLAAQRYVDMDKIPHSGGEGIATALFLYFVMMKLRYEVRADSRSAEGMPLLLDNPLGKNTNRQMWQAIMHLATSVGMQLLVFTGAQDYEPLSLFKRHVRLAKSKLNPATQRLHVTISDYQFNYDQAELLA